MRVGLAASFLDLDLTEIVVSEAVAFDGPTECFNWSVCGCKARNWERASPPLILADLHAKSLVCMLCPPSGSESLPAFQGFNDYTPAAGLSDPT